MSIKYNACAVAVFALLAAGSVQAADLIVEEPVVVAAAGFDWSGFYAGVNAGIVSGTFEHPFLLEGFGGPGVDLGGSIDVTASGFTGGLQAGYNAVLDNNILLGLEADISASTADGRISATITTPGGDVAFDAGTRLDWIGTIRPRIGFVNDNFVVYGTAGLAFGHSTSSINYDLTGVGGPSDTIDEDNGRFGWTVGAGIEYALADNVTLKTEYSYTDLGSETLFSANPAPGTSASLESAIAFHSIKVGLNFHF